MKFPYIVSQHYSSCGHVVVGHLPTTGYDLIVRSSNIDPPEAIAAASLLSPPGSSWSRYAGDSFISYTAVSRELVLAGITYVSSLADRYGREGILYIHGILMKRELLRFCLMTDSNWLRDYVEPFYVNLNPGKTASGCDMPSLLHRATASRNREAEAAWAPMLMTAISMRSPLCALDDLILKGDFRAPTSPKWLTFWRIRDELKAILRRGRNVRLIGESVTKDQLESKLSQLTLELLTTRSSFATSSCPLNCFEDLDVGVLDPLEDDLPCVENARIFKLTSEGATEMASVRPTCDSPD